MGDNESYRLTYFNLKAVGEPIRLIFAYAGVKYEDNRIEHVDWPEVKKNYPYGQLPVLQVGDKVLAQSNAICRYLARKYNLIGNSDWEAAKLDEIADTITDLRQEFAPVHREEDPAKKAQLAKNFVETIIPKYFGKYDELIGKNEGSPFLVGKSLSWVDLMVSHYMQMFGILLPNLQDMMHSYPKLAKMQKIVFALPQIKAWIDNRPQTHL